MMPTPSRLSLIFAGGGTGGHYFPAVAIARKVERMMAAESDTQITFIGTKRGIEYRLRDQLGYPLRLINIRGLARSFSLSNLKVPFLIVSALCRARTILKELQPDLVVGTGGYVSWPILKMAQRMKIPTVMQEQNSFPGLVTRRLAPRAERVYLGFEAARRHLDPTAPVMLTGNPVRADLAGGDRKVAMNHFGLDPKRKTIVVLGGSQGARAINQAVLMSIKAGNLAESYQLLWQTGKLDYEDIVAAVGERGPQHFAFSFEHHVNLVYAAADLVIARAGAISLAEIEASGKPALLIPYPFAAGDHQRYNARSYVEQGFAALVDPNDLDDIDLIERAISLVESGDSDQMTKSIRQKTAGKKPAVDLIAEDILRLVIRKQEAAVAN